MSRWNPCCCSPIGLTGDMVLVRAGWYHFLVMTLDGRINCFIGSGLEGAKGVTYGQIGNQDTRAWGVLDYDWMRVNESPYFSDAANRYITTFNPNQSANRTNWTNSDQDADIMIHSTAESVTSPAREGVGSQLTNYNCSESSKYPIVKSLFNVFTGICRSSESLELSLYQGCTGCTGICVYINGIGCTGCSGCTGINNDVSSGETGPVGRGCWYTRNRITTYDGPGNEGDPANNFTYNWPHGYIEFDGEGSRVERPYKLNTGNTFGIGGVTSERWKYLITKEYGTFGDLNSVTFSNYLYSVTGPNGVTFLTGMPVYEYYKPAVIPAPVGHPLCVPTLPTKGAGSTKLKVIDIECGAYHNIIRLEDNTIMCWGLNSMGQCNVPESLKAGITLGRHPKINKIVSIHAGFSTSAVLFNDGTALCWGDPDVACAVNNWTDIKISPIKRHNGQAGEGSACMGPGSIGYPDPISPQYPSNKYDNPTYNANTDWFAYWRKGTPGFPHFDLGVHVDPIYPVNWLFTGNISDPIDGGTDKSWFDPKVWCEDCAGLTIYKDFAVGMRRSGQIVTTRKSNAADTAHAPDGPTRLYSRDCSFDSNYVPYQGTVTPKDRGYNYNNTLTCCNDQPPVGGVCPGCVPSDPIDCKFYMTDRGYITPCSQQQYDCPAYDNWDFSSNSFYSCTPSLPPRGEGIGCFNCDYGESGYDPNWAITTTNLWTAGQQVRPAGFTGGLYPSWNRVNASYGWSTKVAAGSRSRPSSRGLPGIPSRCANDGELANRCTMNFGADHPCESFCPSDGNFSGAMGVKGVPGIFRYPSHMARSLTCVAGTNTVAWVSSTRVLTGQELGEGLAVAQITESAYSKCEKYHLMDDKGLNRTSGNPVTNNQDQNSWDTDYGGNGGSIYVPDPCAECGYVGGNASEHSVEVGNTTYAGIYIPSDSNTEPPSGNGDSNGVNNPFYTDPFATECSIGPALPLSAHMFPTRPWGPWNIETDVGFAVPNYVDLAVCARKYNKTGVYVTYRNGGGTDMPLENLPWNIGSRLGPGMPTWFMNNCYKQDQRPAAFFPITAYGTDWPNSMQYYFPISAVGTGCDPDQPPFSQTATVGGIDCYTTPQITNNPCACSPRGVRFLWKCDGISLSCESSTAFAVDAGGEDKLPGYPVQDPNGPWSLSGQTGFMCDAGLSDSINRWCFNNPVISYATGRSFGVHIRACPWSRGLSGEFVWASSCNENRRYYNKLMAKGYSNSTSDTTKGLKLWVSGTLEDPCPPWPINVGVTGATFGHYPSWVPVPSTNTKKLAQKGQWSGVTGSWTSCLSSYQWNYTAWGYTLGCTGSGCISGEISWPIGTTGCTGFNGD